MSERPPEQPGPEDPKVERLGSLYAKALLAELEPRPGAVREIAARLHLELHDVEADGFEGALIRATNAPIGAIAVRNSIREAGRKNFTIAHEIGHFVLPGHDHASVVCTADDVADWTDVRTERNREREANEFAAELLMPTELVRVIARGSTPSLDVIEKIAREFDASLSAAASRYCDVVVERCAVIWSTDRSIQWAKRSPAFPFFLPKGWAIKESTFAARCFAGERVPGHPQMVPAHLWTSSADVHSTIRLFEQSKALPAYQSVLSLVWIDPGA